MAAVMRSRWLHHTQGGMPTVICSIGIEELHQHRAAIVLGQCGAVVAPHAVAEQGRVVVVEQRPFEAPPALGVPVRRHHVGEIAGGQPDAPGVPIEVAQVVRAVLWDEAVPDMGVAMHQADVAIGQDTRLQAGRGGEEALVELPPLARQAIAQMVGEALERSSMALHHLACGLGIDTCADRHAKPRIVPPRGMEARQRLHHAPARRFIGWQRPLRCDLVRVGEIFEQQVPFPCLVLPVAARSSAAPGPRASPARPWHRTRLRWRPARKACRCGRRAAVS